MWQWTLSALGSVKLGTSEVRVAQAGMELRVLHAVAYQATWYGEWGYEFGRGAFNITKTAWRATLKNAHNLSMDAILSDFKAHTSDSVLPEIIDRYQVPVLRRREYHGDSDDRNYVSNICMLSWNGLSPEMEERADCCLRHPACMTAASFLPDSGQSLPFIAADAAVLCLYLQVSFPGEPDPVTLGSFLQRMLFLLSKPQAAAAILGVEYLPVDLQGQRQKASNGKIVAPRGRKLSAVQSKDESSRLAAATRQASAAKGLRNIARSSLPGQKASDALENTTAPAKCKVGVH